MKLCVVDTCSVEVPAKNSSVCKDHTGKCLGCGNSRDRGPWTKYCSACYVKPCRRCGEDNLRGPYTTLCKDCKDLPPKDDRTVCKRCTQPNDRGGRTYICSVCVEADSALSKKANSRLKKMEAPKGMSWCSACDQYKEQQYFLVTGKNKITTCTECYKRLGRESHLMRSYGITEEQYVEIFTAQGSVCGICGNKPKAQKFHVDHDHKTGMVRGLLCLWCNHKLLGGARDSVEYLQSAINYLQNPPAVVVVGELFGPKITKKK